MEINALTALSPLDGRYYNETAELRPIASEYGLMYYRLVVEIRWLIFIANEPTLSIIDSLDTADRQFLENLLTSFDLNAASQIKAIEQTTRHDVKAIEYYIRNQLEHHPKLAPLIPFIHFGCTSEDINNVAYSLMLDKIRQDILLPAIQQLIIKLQAMANANAAQPMLSRTHGQPASPTTLGKELINVVMRLQRQQKMLSELPLLAKFNGAVGNYNAHASAYPDVDWPALSQRFITSLALTQNAYTTQIEPHDFLAEFLQNLTRINCIIIDLDRDLWGYISLGYFNQQKIQGSVGSSTMPHKINPIDFENSEGNLGIANALANHLANKLPISRWQRDLSDSTVLRNLGQIAGYSLLAYQATLKGLNKLVANSDCINADLQQHWEVLAEAVQTVMRRYGIMDAYERLKDFTQGKIIDVNTLADFIDQQPLSDAVKTQLKSLTPATYLGFAQQLTEQGLRESSPHYPTQIGNDSGSIG